MITSRAAVRYAKALLELAVDKSIADPVEKDMRSFIKNLDDNEELRQVLNSPIVKAGAKEKALGPILEGCQQMTRDLISLLLKNKRIDLLHAVALKYIVLYEQLKNRDVATVTTAVPLTSELEARILKKVEEMTGSKVSLKNKVDPDLVGGFILRVGDIQYNASLASKLENLKREFIQST